MIEVRGLTKRFGSTVAVDDLSFTIEPGRVTGFLGPNGAGKTTTLRAILGLVRPTAGTATIGGRPYAALEEPLRTVGAVLEASAFHPGRSGRNHLRSLAVAAGIGEDRVDHALGAVGLTDAAGRRVGGYSLGMRQRLGIAGALLGDPQLLVLDEPANGLDPQGIRWLRDSLRAFAADGRTVFVSSHVLSEIAQTADSVVIINRGKLIEHLPLAELEARAVAGTRVRSPEAGKLLAALDGAGIEATALDDGRIVARTEPPRVGEIAASKGIVLHELTAESSSLEDVFLALTEGE
ncbi:MAG TPA: ATP-binding cassette domain-containing protein [Gaiellaceae bacterium]